MPENMTPEQAQAKSAEMMAAINAAATAVSDDANMRLNALATLYVELCFFGGLGVNETATGVARIYQGILDNLRPKAVPAPDDVTDVQPVTETSESL